MDASDLRDEISLILQEMLHLMGELEEGNTPPVEDEKHDAMIGHLRQAINAVLDLAALAPTPPPRNVIPETLLQ